MGGAFLECKCGIPLSSKWEDHNVRTVEPCSKCIEKARYEGYMEAMKKTVKLAEDLHKKKNEPQ